MDKSVQKKLLEFKMGFLEEQRTLLIMKVDAHVNKVLFKGRQWLVNSEVTTNSSFQDISHLLEETVLFVTEKMGEIPESHQATANSSVMSDNCGKESVTLNFLVNDMETIKGRLSSLTSKMEAFERQTESNAEGIITKHNPLEEKHKTELGQMKTVLENTMNEQAKVRIQQDERLNFLEHHFQAFTEKESHYKNQMNLMDEELKKQGNSTNQLRNQLNKRLMAINTTVKKMEQLQLSEKQIDSSATGSRQVQVVEYKVDQLQTTARRVSEKVKQHELLLQDLDKKVKDAESSVETLRSSKDFEKHDNIEDILALMDSKDSGILNKVTEQSKKMETQFKTAMQEMQTLLPIVTEFESRCVGFTAHFPDSYKPIKGRIVEHFAHVHSNKDGSFDLVSGIFKAPCDGVYLVALTVSHYYEGNVVVSVTRCLSDICPYPKPNKVCVLKAHDPWTKLAVVYLDMDDTLHVEVEEVNQRPELSDESLFTCFLMF